MGPRNAKKYATEALEGRLPVELGRLPRDVAATIEWFLERYGVAQNQLALDLGVTESRVSQILSGDANLTLRSLAAVAAALDAHFEIDLVPNDPGRALVNRPMDPGTVDAVSEAPDSPSPAREPASDSVLVREQVNFVVPPVVGQTE